MPIDTRFYRSKGALTLEAVAEQTGANLVGDGGRRVDGVAASDTAKANELCFFEGKPKAAASVNAQAAACFVMADASEHLPEGVPALICEMPRYSHALASKLMLERPGWSEGDANISETATLSPGVYVAGGAAIGENTFIGPNTTLGEGVQIGRDCWIGPNVSIECALIGNGVTLSAGVRIGQSGFGVMASPDGPMDAPHFGRVIIQDHASIGASTCVDRGAFADTVIGEHTKIDNLCQIAHNDVIGRGALIAAQAGFSGSVTIGDGVMTGGQVGVADHVTIGDGAKMGGGAGTLKDIPPGEVWGGYPAKPLRQWMREVAWLQRQSSGKNKS